MDYTLKMKKPTDRRHRHLTFYRSKFFKMPCDLVPNQGSVDIKIDFKLLLIIIIIEIDFLT